MTQIHDLSKFAHSFYALELGKAAEHLVCADLILRGYRTYLSDQGLPYDLVIDLSGTLLRVQVKSACFPKNINAQGRSERIAYNFNARQRGKHGDKKLTNEQCDIIAFVALDIKAISYFPIHEVGTTMQLMQPGFEFKGKFKRNKYESIGGFSIEKAIEKVSKCQK